MRRLHTACALALVLSSPAFAASLISPTPPAQPITPAQQPISVGETQSVSVTGGAKVTVTIQTGSLGLADSAAVKTTAAVGASQSIATTGYSVP